MLCNEPRDANSKRADVLVLGTKFEDMLRDAVARGKFSAAIGREEEWIADRLRSHADPSGAIEQELTDGRWLRVEERRTREGGIVGLRTDITAIKRHQQDLAESEARYRAIVEDQTEFIGRALPNVHTLTFVNEAYARYFGKTPDELIGTSFMDHVPEAERAEVGARLATLGPNNPVVHVEHSAITADGEVRWHHWTDRAIFDADGNFTEIQAVGRDITERRRAKVALRESEERFKAVVDNSPSLISLQDTDSRILMVNRQFETVSGLTNEEARGQTPHDHVSADFADALREIDLEVLQSGHAVERELDLILSDGSARPRIVSKFPVRDPSGEVVAIGGIVTDITEHKRAEREAAEAHARLDDAIESISEGFVLFDADDQFVLCNGKYRGFYPSVADAMRPGAKLDDLARTAFEAGAVRNSGGNVEQWMTIRLRQHRTAQGSHEQQLADGRWVLSSERKTSAGGTVGIRTDITERKRAEEALHKSEERYRLLIEASPDALLVTSQDGIITFANATAVDLHGAQSMDQLIGLDLLALLHPDEREAVAAWSRQAMQGIMGPLVERRRLRLDGSEFVGDTRGVPVTWDGDAAILIVVRDITERKQAEERLRQAQKMEAVGQLTGGIAHDFNNLLAIILGNAELLNEHLGDDGALAENVIRAAHRGGDLTQQLLSFSRRQSLLPKVTDLNELIAGMTDMLRRTLGEVIVIETRCAAELWLTEVDQGQSENAVLNLAINARDAMANGGVLLIETSNINVDGSLDYEAAGVEPGDYVMLAVTDTGVGVPPDALEHVFEPFFTTKVVGKGSGLGLSMVYGFAKQSGGYVAIDSEVDAGTTVKLFLPRARNSEQRTERQLAGKEFSGRGETVLLVEDEAGVRALTATLLEKLGYAVIEASDGASAVAMLESTSRVDLLLTDVVLPGAMSGPKIAEEARRRRTDIKILYMSGYPDQAFRSHGPSEEDAEVLSKPFRRIELAQKVRNALDSDGTTNPQTSTHDSLLPSVDSPRDSIPPT